MQLCRSLTRLIPIGDYLPGTFTLSSPFVNIQALVYAACSFCDNHHCIVYTPNLRFIHLKAIITRPAHSLVATHFDTQSAKTTMSSTMSAYRSTPSPLPDLSRTRLPTLFEVLYRRSLPPVDLYAFYIYMRDQQRSVDYLDFWYSCMSSYSRRRTC